MAPLIPLAVSIASKFIPELIGKALDSKEAEKVAEKVIDVAKIATGSNDPKEALKIVDQQGLTSNLQEQLKDNIMELIELEVKDTQHARETFQDDPTTDKLSFIIMVGSPALIVAAIVGLVYVVTLELPDGVLATISAVFGGVLNQLYQERQQVMNFRFGSSIGSKLKNK